MTIDTSWVAQRNAAFLADPAARLAGNAVATTDVEQVSLDRTTVTSIDTSVSDLVPDASITDQKRRGAVGPSPASTCCAPPCSRSSELTPWC